MKKRIPWIVALLLLAAAGVGVWRYRATHAPPEVTYKTAPVERRHIVGRVTASGTLSALVTVQVGTQVSGRIQKLFADYNSHVNKGEVVAKIDPQLFEASVQQANANYLQAKAGVATAEASALNADKQYARTRALHDQNLAAQADLDTAEANVATTHAAIDAAKAQLAQAAAQLHTAQVNLSYTNIISPIDGIVISRSVDVGQTVQASLSAPTLFTIAQDLTKMQVDTNVAEGDVGRLQVDMKTYFSVDSFPGQRFRGTIRQIRNAATTVQNVVTYDAVIDVDNSDLRLRPGMTANVTIVYDERRDAVAVSNAALRFRPPPSLAGSGSSGGRRRGKGAASASAEGQAAAMPTPAGGAPSEGTPPEGRPGARGPEQAHSASKAGAGPSEGKPPEGPSSESKTVWVMRGAAPQEVTIHTGLSDGTVTEVVDGDLHEGDVVVVDATSADGNSSPSPGPGGPGGPGGGGGTRRLF
jgi:HlyD family secretion protein